MLLLAAIKKERRKRTGNLKLAEDFEGLRRQAIERQRQVHDCTNGLGRFGRHGLGSEFLRQPHEVLARLQKRLRHCPAEPVLRHVVNRIAVDKLWPREDASTFPQIDEPWTAQSWQLNQLPSEAAKQSVKRTEIHFFLGSSKKAAANADILADNGRLWTQPSRRFPLKRIAEFRDVPVVIAAVVKVEPDLGIDAERPHQGGNVVPQSRQAKFDIDLPTRLKRRSSVMGNFAHQHRTARCTGNGVTKIGKT